MKILAFETSCDDTSIAIFHDDKLMWMSTRSQIKEHNKTWWVVPEVAARLHANSIFDVLGEVLKESNTKLEEIDYIWVTTNPWLIPSLLTWITVANTIWNIYKIPVIDINHIQAHIFSNYLERPDLEVKYPLMCLTVSWWHNDIYFMENKWDMQKIWTSWDDAAWESYDKVAKMMGLSYPGGPIISKLAQEYEDELGGGSTSSELFPRVWLDKKEWNFSFSWLKSAVKREVDKRIVDNEKILSNREWKEELLNELNDLKNQNNILLTLNDKKEISYEFQEAVNEVLSYKLVNLWEKYNVSMLALAWWVSANLNLKDKIQKLAMSKNIDFIYPKKLIYSMDNAAMVWILTYYKIQENK